MDIKFYVAKAREYHQAAIAHRRAGEIGIAMIFAADAKRYMAAARKLADER